MRLVPTLSLVALTQYVFLTSVAGMLSPSDQRLVNDFLVDKKRQDIANLPALKEHEAVAKEVAMERTEYTETGRSRREKELLTNMGRLEDQLEAYRRIGPSLQKHLKIQADTAESLKALETKAARIEKLAATLWWDSKVLMCALLILVSGFCIYMSLQTGQQKAQMALEPCASDAQPLDLSDDTTLQDGGAHCEYFALDKDGLTPEDRWWHQPCGPKSGPEGTEPRLESAASTCPVP